MQESRLTTLTRRGLIFPAENPGRDSQDGHTLPSPGRDRSPGPGEPVEAAGRGIGWRCSSARSLCRFPGRGGQPARLAPACAEPDAERYACRGCREGTSAGRDVPLRAHLRSAHHAALARRQRRKAPRIAKRTPFSGKEGNAGHGAVGPRCCFPWRRTADILHAQRREKRAERLMGGCNVEVDGRGLLRRLQALPSA